MAKKKRRRKSKSMTLPIAPLAGLAAGLAAPVQSAMDGAYRDAVNKLLRNYVGLDGYLTGNYTFRPEMMINGLAPLVIGGLVHKYVGGKPLNINSTLARSGVPLIRI